MTCDGVEMSARKFVQMCYKYHDSFSDNYVIRINLLNMAKDFEKMVPTFSAANFGTINRQTIIYIGSSILTYTIIILQCT